ncbi:MAG: hypothetical protein AAGE01_05225 [Pseudomonadota bacterium]
MRTELKAAVCAVVLAAGSAGAVELAEDGRGQVVLLPFVEVNGNSRSELLVRNASATEGKAVRVVARDPVNGRPTASLNLYLGPLDAWRATIEADPIRLAQEVNVARLVLPEDRSCTRPARAELADGAVLFTDASFSENFAASDPGNRLATASLEIIEMGTVDAALATDCGAIAARWADDGVWSADPEADVSAPTGGLEASINIVGNFPARSFRYRGVALADFRDAALHTDAGALSPHLGDVSPAVSSVFDTIQLAQRRVRLERKSTWASYPINAVNAVLLAAAAEGEFVSNRNERDSREPSGVAGAVLTFPTRAFHVDDFYLDASVGIQPGPFAGSAALAPAVTDLDGRAYSLGVPSGLESCDSARASVTQVSLADTAFFSSTCDLQTAVFFVAGPPSEGRVRFDFAGEIVSDEGDVFRGQPVLPILFQSLVEPGVPPVRIATSGWSEYMSVQRAEIE